MEEVKMTATNEDLAEVSSGKKTKTTNAQRSKVNAATPSKTPWRDRFMEMNGIPKKLFATQTLLHLSKREGGLKYGEEFDPKQLDDKTPGYPLDRNGRKHPHLRDQANPGEYFTQKEFVLRDDMQLIFVYCRRGWLVDEQEFARLDAIKQERLKKIRKK